MWIRTQDREMLMDCNAVGIGLEDDKSIYSNGYVLGTYSSKKRALEVLDSIQYALDSELAVFEMPLETEYNNTYS